jgi:hypothetical protein
VVGPVAGSRSALGPLAVRFCLLIAAELPVLARSRKIHRKEVLANIMTGRAKHWSWTIERKDRAGFVGMCLLRPLEGTAFICMGWRLMRQYWGRALVRL